MPRKPLLVLVSGLPGAGKTTLAAQVSEAMSLPLVSLDHVKASLGRTVDGDAGLGGDLGQRAFAASYDVVGTYLRHGVGLVVEKAWRQGTSEADLAPLVERATAVQVHLDVPVAVAVARGRARPARPGLVDMDAVVRAVEEGRLAWSDFGPLRLDVPLLQLGEHPDVDAVSAFVRAHAG